MTPGSITPEAAMAKANSEDMVQFKLKMDGLKQRLAGVQDKKAKLKEACSSFEAVFISKLWQQMRSTVPKEGYLHSKEEDMYVSMFDKEFSEKMAENGGIGLGDMLYDQLKSKLEAESRDTLPGNASSAGIALNENKEGIALDQTEPIALNRNENGIALEKNRSQLAQQAQQSNADQTEAGLQTAYESNLDPMRRVEALARRIELELGPPLADSSDIDG